MPGNIGRQTSLLQSHNISLAAEEEEEEEDEDEKARDFCDGPEFAASPAQPQSCDSAY